MSDNKKMNDAGRVIWVVQCKANNGLWYPVTYALFFNLRSKAEREVRWYKAHSEHKDYRARKFAPVK